MAYQYTRNKYNPNLPTVYNIGTGRYMNEIDVMDVKGRVIPKKVDLLMENRKIAYEHRYDLFGGPNNYPKLEDRVATQKWLMMRDADVNFRDKGIITHLKEYEQFENSDFELRHWLIHDDRRQDGFILRTMIGLQDNDRFDAVTKVIHPKLIMLFYSLLYFAFGAALILFVMPMSWMNIFTFFILVAVVGISFAISFLWLTTFLFAEI